ncbi:hypothetical protein QTP88_013644 [Uroleucon formosanum]
MINGKYKANDLTAIAAALSSNTMTGCSACRYSSYQIKKWEISKNVRWGHTLDLFSNVSNGNLDTEDVFDDEDLMPPLSLTGHVRRQPGTTTRGCISTKLAAFHAVFPRFIYVFHYANGNGLFSPFFHIPHQCLTTQLLTMRKLPE